MKELIDKLRVLAFGMALEPIIHQSVVDDISNAADALERLTAGNSEMLPMPFIQTENNLIAWCKDYGDQRAAAAVLAEQERCVKVCDDHAADIARGHDLGQAYSEVIRKGTP